MDITSKKHTSYSLKNSLTLVDSDNEKNLIPLSLSGRTPNLTVILAEKKNPVLPKCLLTFLPLTFI